MKALTSKEKRLPERLTKNVLFISYSNMLIFWSTDYAKKVVDLFSYLYQIFMLSFNRYNRYYYKYIKILGGSVVTVIWVGFPLHVGQIIIFSGQPVVKKKRLTKKLFFDLNI